MGKARSKMTTPTPTILNCENMQYAIDGKTILSNIDLQLQVPRLGIVGRNGSGKSTFARLIAGLVSPTEGQITLNGHQLDNDRKAALREVGILFQNPDHQIIFPTVSEEIAFGLRQIGQSKEVATENTTATLAQFGKSHWAEAYINTLSQGQKHLLCLMAVVAMGPKAVILDEPFTGLDIPTKAQLQRYLASYHGSLIHITHDPADLVGYDHVIWLEQGKVAQSGAAQDVMTAYTTHMETLGGTDDISDLSR